MFVLMSSRSNFQKIAGSEKQVKEVHMIAKEELDSLLFIFHFAYQPLKPGLQHSIIMCILVFIRFWWHRSVKEHIVQSRAWFGGGGR